jgi:hypothetical protein
MLSSGKTQFIFCTQDYFGDFWAKVDILNIPIQQISPIFREFLENVRVFA